MSLGYGKLDIEFIEILSDCEKFGLPKFALSPQIFIKSNDADRRMFLVLGKAKTSVKPTLYLPS